MEPWDDTEKVRPIRCEDGDTTATHESASGSDPDSMAAARPWLPMMLAGTAVILALGVVSIFGAVEFDSSPALSSASFSSQPEQPGSDDTAPLVTLPPTLEQSIPGLSDRLTLVTLTEEALVTLVWDPSFRVPREYPASASETARAVFARFDSGGRMLAVATRSSRGYAVYLGEPTDLGTEPDLISASPTIWHATDVGSIAWIVLNDDGAAELRTGSVNPLSGELMNEVVVTGLGSIARIVRWDSDGFVLDDGSEVHSLDAQGATQWSRVGSATSATPSLIVATVPDDDLPERRWSVLDRATGDSTDLIAGGSTEDLWAIASHDLDIVATVSANESRSTLTVSGPDLAAVRIVQIDADVTPIGFSTGNAYFIFEPAGTNDLVFVDWRTGARHSLEIPDRYEVLALDLR